MFFTLDNHCCNLIMTVLLVCKCKRGTGTVILPSPMKGYSISSLTPCSISTSSVLSSFTSLQMLGMALNMGVSHVLAGYIRKWSAAYFIFGHSSQTTSCVIWKRPGPSCVVLISWRQLHFLFPGASLAMGLFRTTYIVKEERMLKEENYSRKKKTNLNSIPPTQCQRLQHVFPAITPMRDVTIIRFD